MINETRAAEHGGKIINDTSAHVFQKVVIAIEALETTVISSITPGTPEVENLATYYNGATLLPGDVIKANVKAITLTSGAVQAFYRA